MTVGVPCARTCMVLEAPAVVAWGQLFGGMALCGEDACGVVKPTLSCPAMPCHHIPRDAMLCAKPAWLMAIAT